MQRSPCKEADAKGVGWGQVARCLATRPLTPRAERCAPGCRGEAPRLRPKAEAALRVVSAFLPKARSPVSGLVNELPSLQKNTLL